MGVRPGPDAQKGGGVSPRKGGGIRGFVLAGTGLGWGDGGFSGGVVGWLGESQDEIGWRVEIFFSRSLVECVLVLYTARFAVWAR